MTTTIEQLREIIKERRSSTAEKSYTKSLIEAGTGKCAKKMGEEAVEAVIAAVSEDDQAFREETADLLYHLLVLLEEKNIAFTEIEDILASRMGLSGHEEKAQRNQ
ncbi:MAG: phosphoribosyl-ATP diphosphatase [Rhizobiales bacterium]|nr:phosphoribosyl-ATP diphosphatase [Hyphomicrobiales bacterium]